MHSQNSKIASRNEASNFIKMCKSQDTVATIQAMMTRETNYLSQDYLVQLAPQTSSMLSVDPSCRATMCNWCFQIVDFFKLSRQSVHVAISCMDRFLSTKEGLPYLASRSLFQLANVTCLYIAIKVHEPVELSLSLLIELCRGAYNQEQILKTENIVLSAIGWAVNPPSSHEFIRYFIDILPDKIQEKQRKELNEIAAHQADTALMNYNLSVLCNQSVIAIASLINALFVTLPEFGSDREIFFAQVAQIAGTSINVFRVMNVRDELWKSISPKTISRIGPLDDLNLCTEKDLLKGQVTCHLYDASIQKTNCGIRVLVVE